MDLKCIIYMIALYCHHIGIYGNEVAHIADSEKELSNYIRDLTKQLGDNELRDFQNLDENIRDGGFDNDDGLEISETLREVLQRDDDLKKGIRKLRVLCRFGCRRCCFLRIVIENGVNTHGLCDVCSWCCYIWKVVTNAETPHGVDRVDTNSVITRR